MVEINRLPMALINHRRKIHLAVIILTILLIPGALRALQPFDIENYSFESPELLAEEVLRNDFQASNLFVGFLTTVREPSSLSSDFLESDRTSPQGSVLGERLPPADSIANYFGDGKGAEIIPGGVLNISTLREISRKTSLLRSSDVEGLRSSFSSTVTGTVTDGVTSLSDILDIFMSNSSYLTKPGTDFLGRTMKPPTNWTDCGALSCLKFNDENLTQSHIDLAVHRIVNATPSTFLRMLSSDRTFVHDPLSPVIGPVGGYQDEQGTFINATWAPGRWSASSSWLLIQFDRKKIEDSGWTFQWSDARQPSRIYWSELGLHIGGYRLTSSGLVVDPPEWVSNESCSKAAELGEAPCSWEWAMASLEQQLRTTDSRVVTLTINTALQVEVNRELQSSIALIFLMIVGISVLLWFSLRRISDVALVGLSLFFSLIWMQGLISLVDLISRSAGIQLIHRSQFSYLLPILILALGIDDSLHALHRYKEERRSGASSKDAAQTSIHRVGRAIMLTSLTTMAAFSANLWSSIPALRSFGIEAAIGVLSAWLMTGVWVPLLRLSHDLHLEKQGIEYPEGEIIHLIPVSVLSNVALRSFRHRYVVILVALIITIPSAIAMSRLEGDFRIEDFMDGESDFGYAVQIVNQRFPEEGEPAAILIEGNITDPALVSAIEEVTINMNHQSPNDPNKLTRLPNGLADVRSIYLLTLAMRTAHFENQSMFEPYGWNPTLPDNGVGCRTNRIGGFLTYDSLDLEDSGCLSFIYGVANMYGIPRTTIYPEITPDIAREYIAPEEPLNPSKPQQTMDGKTPTYLRTAMRFGLRQPEDFPGTSKALSELEIDLSPLHNLSSGDPHQRADPHSFSDFYPVTWVIPTDKPVTRFVAADSMQNELQSALLWGSLFCFLVLMVGFRSFIQAIITTGPTLMAVIWLYGMIHLLGLSLNAVTVAISAISLGVGIDYCIHVTERFREERSKGESVDSGISTLGSACGLALVGSAASDILGFLIISLSSMGFFSTFGLLSALMISFSLIASMIVTTAALGMSGQLIASNGLKEDE